MKPQSYCMGKEFAFNDKKNNNREMKPSAHTEDQILACFCVSPFTTTHIVIAQASRPPVSQVNNSCAENLGCGGRQGRRKGDVDVSNGHRVCVCTILEIVPLSVKPVQADFV